MKYKNAVARLGLILGAMLFVFAELGSAQSKVPSGGLATFTATAVGKKDANAPAITMDDVQLFVNKERKQISDWKKSDQLFLAILIDDSIDTTAAGQWNDLKAFIMAQPASTHIALGYIRNNTTMVAQDFTQNKELVTKALRIPLGRGGIGSSPYLGTIDMLKRWPNTGQSRSIILITSGIDYFRGPSFGPFYPDLDPLIQRAQKQNTNIWTVYYPSSGHRGRGFFEGNLAQNNISKLSEDTGAESYFLGYGMPVSLKPYFDELGEHLSNQYLVSFVGNGGSKGKFARVQLKTELKDVEFFTPSNIWLPPAK
ncbi:MAG TPA: hypothetical protein VGF61_20335 [Candidatus Acidoferrum sp.]